MSGPSPLEWAKAVLTIPELWHLRGWPGKPGKSCLFPNGSDKRPSASVFAEGRLLKDFRTGKTYDAPALLAEVEGIGALQACRLFIQLSGTCKNDAPRFVSKAAPAPVRTKPELERLRLCPPSESEILVLSRLRHVSTAAVRLALERGFLWCCDSTEGRAWVLRDGSEWVAVARRMDGKGWECIGGAKARLVKGSRAAWPLGAAESLSFPAIALVEGGPDFLAAFHFILEAGMEGCVAPVAVLGAGMRIDAEALPLLRGKRVRIFVDDDEAGGRAFARWSEQLRSVEAVVDGFGFSDLIHAGGQPVKDLNDCTQLHEQSAKRWGATLSGMMKFGPEAQKPPAPVSPGGWWNSAERAAIRGTELEGNEVVEELARMFNARLLLDKKGNLSCPA